MSRRQVKGIWVWVLSFDQLFSSLALIHGFSFQLLISHLTCNIAINNIFYCVCLQVLYQFLLRGNKHLSWGSSYSFLTYQCVSPITTDIEYAIFICIVIVAWFMYNLPSVDICMRYLERIKKTCKHIPWINLLCHLRMEKSSCVFITSRQGCIDLEPRRVTMKYQTNQCHIVLKIAQNARSRHI